MHTKLTVSRFKREVAETSPISSTSRLNRLQTSKAPTFYQNDLAKKNTADVIIIIIISPLMSPLLGHTPSLWITHKENGP
jgi:hypothetical protein